MCCQKSMEIGECEFDNNDILDIMELNGMIVQNIGFVCNEASLKHIRVMPFEMGNYHLIVKDRPDRLLVLGNGLHFIVTKKTMNLFDSMFRVAKEEIVLKPVLHKDGYYACWWDKSTIRNKEKCEGNCHSCEKYPIVKTKDGYKLERLPDRDNDEEDN